MTNEIIIKNKRFCFDLDNTLVTFPTITNDYTSVKPDRTKYCIFEIFKKVLEYNYYLHCKKNENT